MLSIRSHMRASRSAQRGLGLVELMVGITVGLIVAAGAAVVATQQINEHRRLMLEVQIQQDLRIAADLLQQELRRAGFRGKPANGVWEPARNPGTSGEVPAKDAASNPYSAVTKTKGADDLYYEYTKEDLDSSGTAVNDNVVKDNEKFGVVVSNNTLFLQLGVVGGKPNWQPITDPNSVLITSFDPHIEEQSVPLDDICNCPPGSACPTMKVRRIDFTIKAVAKSDSNVKRTLKVSERVRADDISGVCP